MKLKDKIYIVCIILGILVTFYYMNRKYQRETDRLISNYEARLVETGRQEELKLKEFKKFHEARYDSLLQKYKIKVKNVETILVTKYNYKDTVIKTYKTVYDTVSETDKFDILNKCYSIKGEVFEGFVTIKNIEVNDKLTTFTYKDFDKKFLFIKYKPFYTTKVYSECKGDTIKVEENIKIIKRKRNK